MASFSAGATAVMALAVLAMTISVLGADAATLPTATEGAGYLPATIAQPSVTSTAFNPAIQNPGGTTNSAGTFDVVSLSKSSSYSDTVGVPQTTTFSASSASYLSTAQVANVYDTSSAATPGQLTGTAGTAGSTSRASSSSTAAATGESDGAGQIVTVPPPWKGFLAAAVAVLAGATWVAAA